MEDDDGHSYTTESDTMPNEGERRKQNYYRVKEVLEGPILASWCNH